MEKFKILRGADCEKLVQDMQQLQFYDPSDSYDYSVDVPESKEYDQLEQENTNNEEGIDHQEQEISSSVQKIARGIDALAVVGAIAVSEEEISTGHIRAQASCRTSCKKGCNSCKDGCQGCGTSCKKGCNSCKDGCQGQCGSY